MKRADKNPSAAAPDVPTLVIKPGGMPFLFTLSEIWRYRELFLFLVWRDISVKYKQTILGVLWIVIQPLVATLMFTLVFNRLAGIPSEGIPYPLFVLAGIIPWNFFAGSLNRAGESLVGNTDLVKKVYFPRLIIPASAALAVLVDFAIMLLTMGGLMVYYGYKPGIEIIALPMLTLLVLLFAVGISLFFSALNVRFRDVKFVLAYLIQMWMYATPVVYPYSLITERYPRLAAAAMLNPMVGIVEGFRWALLRRPFRGWGCLCLLFLRR